MNHLWNWVDRREMTDAGKIRIFLLMNCLLCSVLGLVVWLFVSRFALNTWDWALCFVGYPGFFVGFLGGCMYLCRQ